MFRSKWIALPLCLATIVPAHAQVLLKPQGQSGWLLRAKALEANVEIDRQIATTKLLLTFGNEDSDRIEADFIYAMPPGALASSFAYWYGDEKVVARVVEKEEAAAVYSYITSRMRDPA